MTIDEMIDVLQAAKAGRTIEARSNPGEVGDDGKWHTVCPNWDFYRITFRVKPEPLEGFIQTAWLMDNPPTSRSIRVREVL